MYHQWLSELPGHKRISHHNDEGSFVFRNAGEGCCHLLSVAELLGCVSLSFCHGVSSFRLALYFCASGTIIRPIRTIVKYFLLIA